MKRLAYLFLCVVTFFSLANIYAIATETPGSASFIVRETVESVRKTVTASGSLSSEQVDRKLRDIIGPVFDFREMSMRCLGANWRKGTTEQRKEFIDLFSELLAKNYLKKIRENASDSEFRLVGGKSNEKKAEVKTIVKYDDDQEVRINYRLRRKGKNWRIYDVVIENIGLVSNYRSEFSGIVKNEQFAGLLTRLREKSKK